MRQTTMRQVMRQTTLQWGRQCDNPTGDTPPPRGCVSPAELFVALSPPPSPPFVALCRIVVALCRID